MSVPFEQLGDGQVGRLVYQVIGKDGPIPNPQNIVYLRPEDGPSRFLADSPLNLSGGLAGLNAGLAGINLLASVANLAVSAVILAEVWEISHRIDDLRLTTIKILDSLDALFEKVVQIDIKVSEDKLRRAIDYIASRAMTLQGINLQELKRLEDDFHQFMGTVPGYNFGSRSSFRIGSDMRDKLNALHSFLFKTRELVARQHNVRADGDPLRTLSVHRIYDYTPEGQSGYRQAPLIIKKLMSQFDGKGIEIDAVLEEILYVSLKGVNIRDRVRNMVRGFKAALEKSYREKDAPAWEMFNSLQDQINDATDSELVDEWEKYWLLKTDMGLVWRVNSEIRAIGDYGKEFPSWNRPELEPLGSSTILIDCSWKKPLELSAKSGPAGYS
jgi:hypothetical protein